MKNEIEKFWESHLKTTDKQLIHFGAADTLDLTSIRGVAEEIGFAFFILEAKNIDSEDALLGELAKSMKFPLYFGQNWDAVLDLTRDLSWTKAAGYVLIISGGDNLPLLPEPVFSTFVDVLEATVRDWRDERGEFDERSGPVPFHVIFAGDEVLKESLLGGFRESLCEHLGELSVNLFEAPVRLRRTATYQDAERLARADADSEVLLSFLRKHGMDERDSMYSIAGLLRITMSEAKSLIFNSQTWVEVRGRDEQFRNVARDALRDLRLKDE